MLNVKRDESRREEDGQYFIELTRNRDLTIINCDRLGYWCDKGHLKHMVLQFMKQFNTFELFYHLLEDKDVEKDDLNGSVKKKLCFDEWWEVNRSRLMVNTVEAVTIWDAAQVNKK